MAEVKQLLRCSGYYWNHYHEKENYNNDIAYRGVCSVKHKLCPTTAHETATSPAGCTLIEITLIGD
jgi:hypothetical protein